jgi:uncharacterized protein
MRLIIDIGHPGHVHYFRNLYFILKKNGHEILLVARDKEITFELLHHYDIPFSKRGKGKKSLFGKLVYLCSASFLIFKLGRKFRPDLILSFSSPYASIASFFLRCYNIILDDTEVGKFERFIYRPLANLIITPNSFRLELGIKHVRFDGYMELAYLNSKYFKPDPKVLLDLGIGENEKFVIIRFVSWEASHDRGQRGLSPVEKLEIVKLCSNYAKVFISSENILPESLKSYELKLEPYRLHDALFYASVYVGEGATTASEACILGTPSIYINTIYNGYTEEQAKFGVLYNFNSFNGVKERIERIFNEGKKVFSSKSETMLKNRIDLTSFLSWLLEKYPSSKMQVLKDPEYHRRFN